ncbi:MAG: tetratricopeptide repeat protein [Gemmatimonadota bacterium]
MSTPRALHEACPHNARRPALDHLILLWVLWLLAPCSLISAQEPPSLPLLEAQVEEARASSPQALALALQELLTGYAYYGQHSEAIVVGREAVGILAATADTAALASLHNDLGLAFWNQVEYDSAVAHFSQAAELQRALGDLNSLARVFNNLGAAHYQWGNYELALTWFLQALEYRRQLGDEAGEALALTNVGLTYRDWGQLEGARSAYDEAIRISDRIGYVFGQAYARLNLAELHLLQGELSDAEGLFRRSLETYVQGSGTEILPPEALGGEVLNRLGLAQIHVMRGDAAGAIGDLLETLDLARQAESPRYEARTRLELGKAFRAEGRLEAASEQLQLGLTAARARDQRPITVELLAALAEVEEARNRPAEALRQLQAHLALRDSLFSQGAAQRIAAMEAQSEIERQARENVELREEQLLREAAIQRQRTFTAIWGGLFLFAVGIAGILVYTGKKQRERATALILANRNLEQANDELRRSAQEIQTLRGLIPICAHCKKVRDDEGYWGSVEVYVTRRSEAYFSHSICTECGPRLYGEDWVGPGESTEDQGTGIALSGDTPRPPQS